MENEGRRVKPPERRQPRVERRRGLAPGRAGILVALSLLLLPLRSGLAQGNPAVLIRQMQARIAALTGMLQQQQQQMAATVQRQNIEQKRLERLRAAVNAAAVAGDPAALAVRSSSAETEVDKLTAQFEARARPGQGGASPDGADRSAADLSGARLPGAVLRGARLAKVNLKGADLTRADLTHAVLTGANLRGAKLQGANLTAADLTNADLTDDLYDDHSRWSTGFDPAQHGALLVM